ERARALGATAVGHPERAKELLAGGADVAFDAVGLTETAALALRHTRGGGVCVLVGMPPAGARLEGDPFDFTNREKTLTGTIYGFEDPGGPPPALLDDVAAGRLALSELLGPSYPLEAADEAFRS